MLQQFTANDNSILGACTSSQADDGAQALPFPHDDGGQNLTSQQAVLDARCEGVEPLVTQHGDLVVQSAATHRKLELRTCGKLLLHISLKVEKQRHQVITFYIAVFFLLLSMPANYGSLCT